MTTAAPAKKQKASKPKPKAKPKGIDQAAKAEVFDKVAALEDQIRIEETEVETLRQELKGAKESVAGLRSKMRRAVWEAAHPEAHPLYNAAAQPAAPATNGQATAADDESWKNETLAAAFPDLQKKILEHLDAANLRTLGELAAWTAANQGRNRLTDIAGIGEAAAKKIEEASEAFWTKRKQALAQVQEIANGTAPNVDTTPESTKQFLESVVDCLDEEGIDLESIQRLRVHGLKTFGDIDSRASKENLPYLEIIKHAGFDAPDADTIVKAITKVSDTFSEIKDDPKPAPKKKGGKK